MIFSLFKLDNQLIDLSNRLLISIVSKKFKCTILLFANYDSWNRCNYTLKNAVIISFLKHHSNFIKIKVNVGSSNNTFLNGKVLFHWTFLILAFFYNTYNFLHRNQYDLFHENNFYTIQIFLKCLYLFLHVLEPCITFLRHKSFKR